MAFKQVKHNSEIVSEPNCLSQSKQEQDRLVFYMNGSVLLMTEWVSLGVAE